MGDVVRFNGVSTLDFPVDDVLDMAKEANLTEAVVIGTTADGEFYLCSAKADGPVTLWLLAIAQKRLLENGDGDE